ncbi:E3 ubiquitin-protein ligase AIRP2 [Bienertia sinuspersici]
MVIGNEMMRTRRSFRESIKALEADIQHANTLEFLRYRENRKPVVQYFSALEVERDQGCIGDPILNCFRLQKANGWSLLPNETILQSSSSLVSFLVQWTDCYLAGALGFLRILIYMTYEDGKTTMSVHEKKASIRQFYGVIFPSLMQLQTGITELEDRKQKEVCALRYRRNDVYENHESMALEREIEEECGICMEINNKVVLPNCSHSMCFKCYKDWYARSQSCPFCRDCLKGVKSGDLWIYTDDRDIVDSSVIMMENLNRLFIYLDKLPLSIHILGLHPMIGTLDDHFCWQFLMYS